MERLSTLRLALAVLAIGLATETTAQTTRYVKPTWINQAAVDADPDAATVGPLTFGTTAFRIVGDAAGSAVRASVNGDTIVVFPGYYNERINISGATGNPAKNVNIIGPNEGVNPNTVTRGPEAIFRGIIFNNRTGIVIDGLTFDGEFNTTATYNVSGGNTSGVTIRNNRFINYARTAIDIGNPTNNLTFERNLVRNVVNLTGTSGNSGMNLFVGNVKPSSNIRILNNSFRDIQYAGIQPSGDITGILILGNSFQNTGRHGINIGPNVKDVTIAGNYIANVNTQSNRADILTGGLRIYSGTDGVSNVIIDGNTIDNANHGIFFRPNTGSPWNPNNPTSLPQPLVISNNNITNSVYGGITQPGTDISGNITGSNNFFSGNAGGDFINDDADTNPNQLTSPAGAPIIADPDGDGLTTSEEIYLYLTDPALFDTDTDGVGDGLEVALGTDPLNNASTPANVPGLVDADNDGYWDFFKVLLGSDPNDADSRPLLGDVNGNGVIDNGDAGIVFQVISGNLPPFSFDTTLFDVNRDGIVNNQDANILFNRFLGVSGFDKLPYVP